MILCRETVVLVGHIMSQTEETEGSESIDHEAYKAF